MGIKLSVTENITWISCDIGQYWPGRILASGNLWRVWISYSEAFRGFQRLSEAFRGFQRRSDAFRAFRPQTVRKVRFFRGFLNYSPNSYSDRRLFRPPVAQIPVNPIDIEIHTKYTKYLLYNSHKIAKDFIHYRYLRVLKIASTWPSDK